MASMCDDTTHQDFPLFFPHSMRAQKLGTPALFPCPNTQPLPLPPPPQRPRRCRK